MMNYGQIADGPTRRRIKSIRDVGELVVNPIQLVPKYQRDIAAKMNQLCYLIRTSHSSRSLGGTGYFLRWNRRGEFEH